MKTLAKGGPIGRMRQWAEWRAAFLLVLILVAFLAAPDARAWDPFSPIVGSIADDLIAIGDRQYGKTDFIVQRQDGLALKVRHQRATLDGAEIFCSQHPYYTQQSFLGIRVNRYDESQSLTICNLAEETVSEVANAKDHFLQGEPVQEAAETSLEKEAVAEWLLGFQLKTERSYCIGNFESREFTTLPDHESWISEGTVLEFQPEMFLGFDVMVDRDSGTVFALSAPLNQESAREMGCALPRPMIVVKLSVVPQRNVADSQK